MRNYIVEIKGDDEAKSPALQANYYFTIRAESAEFALLDAIRAVTIDHKTTNIVMSVRPEVKA